MPTYLSVKFDSYETVIRSAHRDKWGRDDTRTTWDAQYLKAVSDQESWDVIAPWDLKAGESALVVYVIYSTGDSFGRSECGSVEVIDVFKTTELAQACIGAVRKTDRRYPAPGSKGLDSAKWVREDNSMGKLEYTPWNGYFECLEDVRCELLTVTL